MMCSRILLKEVIKTCSNGIVKVDFERRFRKEICGGLGYVGGKGPSQPLRRKEAFAICRGQEEGGEEGEG